MYRIFFFFFILFISSCGSADDFYEDLKERTDIDSIKVIPPSPNDTTTIIPRDTIVSGKDTIIVPKDTVISDTINVSNQREFEYTKLFKLTSTSNNSQQGFAIYDKYLFNCHHSNDVIDVFDLETQKNIAFLKLDPETIVHCNNVNFGSEFYSKDDKFPLLYVQQRGYASKLNVYRIICEGEQFIKAEKVQIITFESCSWCINTIDNKKNLLYALYGFDGRKYISSFRMPSVHDGNVKIHPHSAYKTYYYPISKVGQDTAFDDKYLYIVCGYSKEGELWRIDIENKVARLIDFTKHGLTGEPEGIDIYNGSIMVSFLNSYLYIIKILD